MNALGTEHFHVPLTVTPSQQLNSDQKRLGIGILRKNYFPSKDTKKPAVNQSLQDRMNKQLNLLSK